jgi:hypothetical protein
MRIARKTRVWSDAMRVVPLALVVWTVAGMVAASEFKPVLSRAQFVDLIAGRTLTRFLVRLDVSPEGRIGGSAFGTQVTGDWHWQGNSFCRTLRFGSEEFKLNCQSVFVRDNTLRFIADEGKGDQADLTLR